jgi:hypothetical protein
MIFDTPFSLTRYQLAPHWLLTKKPTLGGGQVQVIVDLLILIC